MSGIVEYIVAIKGIVDANIAKAMQGIGAAAGKMASDVNKAEASLQGALNKAQAATAAAARQVEVAQRQASVGAQALAGAVSNMERQMGAVTRNGQAMIAGVQQQEAALMNMRARLAEYGMSGVDAAGKVKTLAEAQRELNRVMKEATLANKWAPLSPPPLPGSPDRAAWEKAQGKTGAPVTAGGAGSGEGGGATVVSSGSRWMDQAWKAYGTYFLAKQAGHAIGATVRGPAELDTVRRKMALALGGNADAQRLTDAASDKAFELSGKYRNTTVAENLRIMDDLRANLPEKFPEIVKNYAEPFVKMHSFLKAFEGGKHAGTAEKSLKAIHAAIRSGEIQGNLTGAQIADHAMGLTVANVLFGKDLNIGAYLQANQKAIQALAGSDATFKYVDFPTMVQRLGPTAGPAVRMAFERGAIGNRVMTQSAEYWRELGLVDETKLRPWNYDKNGRIKGSTLIGRSWLKGADEYGTNLTDALITRVMPAIAASKGIKELEGIDKDWKAGDVHALTEKMTALRANKGAFLAYQQAMAALFKDPRAVAGAEELTLGAPSIMMRRKQAEGIQGAMTGAEGFKSWENSMEAVSAQASRMWIAITGKEFISGVMNATDKITAAFAKMGTAINNTNKAISAINAGGKMMTPEQALHEDWRGRGDTYRHARDVLEDVRRKRAAIHEREGIGGVAGGLSRGPGAAVAQAAAQRIQVESQVRVQTHFDPVTFSPVNVNVTVNGASQGSQSSTPSGGHPRGEALATGSSSTAQ